MKISIELNESEIRQILANYINNVYSLQVAGKDIPIQAKSKQNYKSEWEEASIRVNCSISTDTVI